jgi:hypothetical protein
MKSVPQRGSAGVRCINAQSALNLLPEPTRYRVVVLTSSDRNYRNSDEQTASSLLAGFTINRSLFTIH